MAKHVWSLVAGSVVVDRYSNELSIHHVIEQIAISPDPGLSADELTFASGSPPMVLTTYWIRENEQVPETTSFRVRIRTASGAELKSRQVKIDLTEYARMRGMQRFQQIPYDGPGRMWFFVEEVIHRGGKEIATEVAAIPLDVVLREKEKAPDEAEDKN